MCVRLCVCADRSNHAFEHVQRAELSKYYGILIISGDGLVFEVRLRLQSSTSTSTTSPATLTCTRSHVRPPSARSTAPPSRVPEPRAFLTCFCALCTVYCVLGLVLVIVLCAS